MLQLKQIKENKDGSADFTYYYDKQFEDYYKKQTRRKTLDEKKIGEFIVKMLTEAVEGKISTRKRKK